MLNISDLIIGYDGKALGQLPTLSLSKGEHCLVTGSSGSGKTTLLFAIAGMIPVLDGKITIRNTDMATLSETARDRFRGTHIGIIFQTLHLVRSLSVMDNLMLASYAAGLPQNRSHAHTLLKQLGIADKQDEYPNTLSQGQAQRVAIVRAVLHRPALILADEPTSSLDDDNCAKVIALIRQTAQEAGATLLISTHDSRVMPYFDNVIRMGAIA